MDKLVSIIMPVYNREAYLKETLKSIENQEYCRWELIAIDDGSTDGSINILNQFCQKYSEKCIVRSSDKKQSGAAACRNIGIKIANGEYIVFLDSDDLLAPFALKQRVKVMSEQLLDFAVFNQETFTSTFEEKSLFNKYAESKEGYLHLFLINQNPWSVTCPIWRKATLINLQGFDASLLYMEDPDLHTRAIIKGMKFDVLKNYPVDSYYRLNTTDTFKEQVFYKYSIEFRIQFFTKIINLLMQKNYNLQYLSSIKQGYISLLKNFLLARISSYNYEFKEFTRFLYKTGILKSFEYFRFVLIGKIFLTNNAIIRALRLKGLIFKTL